MTTPNRNACTTWSFSSSPRRTSGSPRPSSTSSASSSSTTAPTLEKDESMGRRRLAYTDQEEDRGHVPQLPLPGARRRASPRSQRKMRLSEDVLRFLTVRVDEEMQARPEGRAQHEAAAARAPRRSDAPYCRRPPAARRASVPPGRRRGRRRAPRVTREAIEEMTQPWPLPSASPPRRSSSSAASASASSRSRRSATSTSRT